MFTKKIIKILSLGAVVASVLTVSGCASNKSGSSYGESGHAVSDSMRYYGQPVSVSEEQNLLKQNVYYFGFDSYQVTEDDKLSVYAHAKKLVKNPQSRVRLEGHTDERGSAEYNIALGERRAKAVANLLVSKGVSPTQIDIVSYGAEMPVDTGHDENAWEKNRRVVLVSCS